MLAGTAIPPTLPSSNIIKVSPVLIRNSSAPVVKINSSSGAMDLLHSELLDKVRVCTGLSRVCARWWWSEQQPPPTLPLLPLLPLCPLLLLLPLLLVLVLVVVGRQVAACRLPALTLQ